MKSFTGMRTILHHCHLALLQEDHRQVYRIPFQGYQVQKVQIAKNQDLQEL